MEPLVSILIPAYNSEKWISETIQSALEQTWSKKEIIIVDDGSKDKTLDIARRYESKIVKVITQGNRGSCAARNKALEFAQGDYVQWLDADDLMHPEKISEQLKCVDYRSDSLVLLTSSWARFYSNPVKAKFSPDVLWQDLNPVDWLINKFTAGVWMNPVVWLVSRRISDLAGPWDERLSKDDDGEYACRVARHSELVKFVPESKCFYRIGNSGTLSWSASHEAMESSYLASALSIKHLIELDDSERSRDACCKYLNRQLKYFYIHEPDIMRRMNELAIELGSPGLVSPESWKFFLVRKVLGVKAAWNLKSIVWRAGVLFRKHLESFP